MATMSFRDGAFHDHLRALTAEYERLLLENKAQVQPAPDVLAAVNRGNFVKRREELRQGTPTVSSSSMWAIRNQDFNRDAAGIVSMLPEPVLGRILAFRLRSRLLPSLRRWNWSD